MARDSEAGARDKSRRADPSLDANRSSTRRLSPRRVSNPRVAARAPDVAARPSLQPRAAEQPEGPRNRRVVRATPAVPKGPPLAVRVWGTLSSRGRAGFHALLDGAQALSARLTRDASETDPASASSPGLTRALRVLGVLLVIACGYGVSHFVQRHLTTAPAFAIDAIELKGLARLEREELLHAAGINLGMNVFARSPEDIHARLLRHPWIASAVVRRSLPSRISISVREREPIALLVVEACTAVVPGVLAKGEASKGEDDPACEEPSSLYLVSADAKMVKRTSGKEPVDLPVITGITRQRLASDADLSRRVVTDAVALMHEYRKSGLWQKNAVGEIHLEPNDGFSLYVGDDLTYVRLGAPPFEQKLSRMKKVFERLEHEHARAEYVYLDNEQRPDRVAVRLR
jgi:cell division protein FtsQ